MVVVQFGRRGISLSLIALSNSCVYLTVPTLIRVQKARSMLNHYQPTQVYQTLALTMDTNIKQDCAGAAEVTA